MDEQNTTNTVPVTPQNDAEQNKVMAILAYILFFIPLIAASESRFAKYHANQGLVLFLFFIIGNAIGAILTVILIGICISIIVNIIWFIYLIIGIVNAANGEMKPLPGFGNINWIK